MPINIDELFTEFLAGKDTLRIYRGGRLIFASQQERLAPLMEYVDSKAAFEPGVIVFDRVVGNAAALLLTMIGCLEVHSPFGSEMAIETLNSAGIRYYFVETVDFVRDDSGKNMCPMEQLSLNKTSIEFYRAMKERMRSPVKGRG